MFVLFHDSIQQTAQVESGSFVDNSTVLNRIEMSRAISSYSQPTWPAYGVLTNVTHRSTKRPLGWAINAIGVIIRKQQNIF